MIQTPANPFEGPSLSKDDLDFHIITTTHPYMIEIGLSAFTTGQLYEWMNQTNSKGEYVNLKIFGFNEKKKDPLDEKEKLNMTTAEEVANTIFGLFIRDNPDENPSSRFNFSAWRPFEEGGGEYVNYIDTLIAEKSNWAYEKYNFKSIKFDEFISKEVKIPDFSITNPPIQLSNRQNVDYYISSIIEMNNYVRYREMSTPKSLWNDTDKARYEFIIDIKSSFEKSISWNGVVPFTLNLNTKTTGDGAVENGCVKNEWVEFKLFLFDETLPKENARKVTVNEMVYVAPKIDAFGRAGNKSNGEISLVPRTPKPQDSTAGELDLQWNEFEGKWQSGTPQIVAILDTNIKAAEFPSLSKIKTESVQTLLSRGNMTIVPTGYAIPLIMQNGNPYQISPDYKQSKDCRGDNTEKFRVLVYNRAPRAWASGDIVLLSKIDGVWQPSSFGEPKEVQEEVSVGVDGQWDFMYLMAHSDTYFCNRELTPVTYSQFEEGIRSLYYGTTSDDPLNGNANYTNALNFVKVYNDYFQVTSWDFMGPNIGGLRDDGNALACTQYYIDPSGNEFETPFVDANRSNPFFGCVFPDGYDLGLKWGDYQESSHDLLTPYTNYDPADVKASDFMRQIGQDIRLFENKNVNLSPGAAGGMFILGNRNVSHLPADIALNASPSGVNGSPLKPISALKYLSAMHSSKPLFRNVVDKYFFDSDQKRKGIWMTNQSVDKPFDKYYSTFDFLPVNPGRVTFRPLKLETYASFEFSEYGGTPSNLLAIEPNLIDWWFSPYLGTVPATNKIQRGLFGCRDWRIMSDKKAPISKVAFERNFNNNYPISRYIDQNPPTATKYNDIYGYQGLRYNIDIQRINSRLPESYPVSFYPRPIWSKGWQHGTQDGTPGGSGSKFLEWIASRGIKNVNEWVDFGGAVNSRPAGAVGIIGAQCTVTAKDSISINCESYLGVKSWSNGIGAYIASFKDDGGYASLGASTLHARIFHAWPRNLTIYDPRFFSVFHFNPGVGILDDNDENKKYDWYNDGEFIEDGGSANKDEISYPNGWYQVERSECEVDFRVPTSSQVDAFGISQDLPIQSVINSDTARKKEHCNLMRKRRGQLLPYAYTGLDIGLAAYTNTYIQAYLGANQGKYAKDTDFVILSPGSGYSINDRFFVAGGNGKGTILKPVLQNVPIGTNMAISGVVGFEIISAGLGYSSEDFLDSNLFINCELPAGANKAIIYDLDGNSIEPTIKIIPSGTPRGAGFDGYIVRGKVIGLNYLDKKPLEIMPAIKLNQSIKYPLESEGVTEIEPGLKDTVLDLTKTAKNSDETFGLQNKYDIFFHFHNDISHTYSYDSFSYGAGTPKPYEQHATIAISPV